MSVPIGLLFAALALTPLVADSSLSVHGGSLMDDFEWDWKSVKMVSAGVEAECSPYELIEASGALREFVPRPEPGLSSVPAIYVAPLSQAEQLRAEADRIERREAAIRRWDKALKECEAVVGLKP